MNKNGSYTKTTPQYQLIFKDIKISDTDTHIPLFSSRISFRIRQYPFFRKFTIDFAALTNVVSRTVLLRNKRSDRPWNTTVITTDKRPGPSDSVRKKERGTKQKRDRFRPLEKSPENPLAF